MSFGKLDLKDKKLLYQLDLNCRHTNSGVGKSIGISKQVVEYRIRRLMHEGSITRFTSVIDTYKLGFSKFKLYLSLEGANKEVIASIIEFLRGHHKTEWVATCSGKYDVIAGFIVKNVYEFNEAVQQFEEKFSKHISAKETSASLGVYHWRKEYLLDNQERASMVYQGGKPDEVGLDEMDESLLKLIANNARMPTTEIAVRLKTTQRIVAYRLRNLRSKNILLIHRVFLNLNKFNWIFCKALLRFRGLTRQKFSQFIAECDKLYNLIYIVNSIGAYDLEMDFEVPDFNTFHGIMLELRDKFPEIIKSHDFVIVLSENKRDYYPGCLPALN